MKPETYARAHTRLLSELPAHGWVVHLRSMHGRPLVIPYATKDGNRLDFKTQAIYLDGLSLWIDVRGMSVDSFLADVDRTLAIRRAAR